MSKRESTAAGSVFLVPLRDFGYATGVMARSSEKSVCLGYFFGPRITEYKEVDLSGLIPHRAILVGKFGDLDLLRGTWPVIGRLEPWVADDWPVPQMARIDDIANRAWLSTYDERLRCIAEAEITTEQARQYTYDRMMGSGAVEIRLTKLLQSNE